MFGWFKKKPKAEAEARPAAALARITFADDGITVTAPLGAHLPEVCDSQGLSLGFGCREGGCGTCLIEVIEGFDALSPRSETELEMLNIMAEGNPKARLACQCIVRGDFHFRSLDM